MNVEFKELVESCLRIEGISESCVGFLSSGTMENEKCLKSCANIDCVQKIEKCKQEVDKTLVENEKLKLLMELDEIFKTLENLQEQWIWKIGYKDRDDMQKRTIFKQMLRGNDVKKEKLITYYNEMVRRMSKRLKACQGK